MEKTVIIEGIVDRCRGCLVGGAVGDALGYPVEFMSYREILGRYGRKGITAYDLHHGVARVSDDTQMTMYTANSLLFAYTRMMIRGIGGPLYTYAKHAYKEWYHTQYCKNVAELKQKLELKHPHCWISNIAEMYASRAPGNTCLEAIEDGCQGTVDHKINDSKGCGGVMRVAPVGLFAVTGLWAPAYTMKQGADFAAITHTHELGYIPAAALAYIIQKVAVNPEQDLEDVIIATIRELDNVYGDKMHTVEQIRLLQLAMELAKQDVQAHDAIVEIGKGWVGEEALAIAVYCALKYSDSFEEAVIAAVNHGGDSDSTGAICGNIMGAYLGFNAIPPRFIGKLELLEQLLELADDLATYRDKDIDEFGAEELWEDKYCRCVYPERSER